MMTRSWESTRMSEDSVHVEIDERTPSWAAILDKDRFREELDRLCRVEWNFGAVETVQVGMLRMHKNRCTFDIEFKTKGGSHSLIGKVHDTDRSDIFQAMKDIVDSGFGRRLSSQLPDRWPTYPPYIYYWKRRLRVYPERNLFSKPARMGRELWWRGQEHGSPGSTQVHQGQEELSNRRNSFCRIRSGMTR